MLEQLGSDFGKGRVNFSEVFPIEDRQNSNPARIQRETAHCIKSGINATVYLYDDGESAWVGCASHNDNNGNCQIRNKKCDTTSQLPIMNVYAATKQRSERERNKRIK